MKLSIVFAVLAATALAAPPPRQSGGFGGGSGGRHGGNNQGHGKPQQTVNSQTTAAPQATSAPAASSSSNQGTGSTSGTVDASLVPDFGLQAGLNPNGNGLCQGANGVAIQCSCPPARDAFIAKLSANVKANNIVNKFPAPFPTDSSPQSQLTRINTMISTLQNFDGSFGVGCPGASAPAFGALQSQLDCTVNGNCKVAAGGG